MLNGKLQLLYRNNRPCLPGTDILKYSRFVKKPQEILSNFGLRKPLEASSDPFEAYRMDLRSSGHLLRI